jgi:epoxyqueuosine reductase
MLPEKHSLLIRQEALRLGFDFAGISEAGFLEEEAPRLEQWLLQHRHGRMQYMATHFDKRLDPRLLVDGARSVISLLYNYYPPAGEHRADGPKISRYAYGEDYHDVIREKLKALLHFIETAIGPVSGRAFVDSAPVLERAWAAKSGLGWIGKNSQLITKRHGSYFFLAELITDLPLQPDAPVGDYCGTCTRCIDACPTGAILRPQVVDGSRCISYFTIELKEEFPDSLKDDFDGWAFGCDVCQEVCPWNRFSTPHREPRFAMSEAVSRMQPDDWYELTEEVFGRLFQRSAVKRAGYNGLKRNLEYLRKTS